MSGVQSNPSLYLAASSSADEGDEGEEGLRRTPKRGERRRKLYRQRDTVLTTLQHASESLR